jgi:tetratricopeptide (TPR) repeat protein
LKTLPAGDRDLATRKERFFREARAASALNHPNIITIYEISSDHGIDFIAMEYVEGRTLGELLRHIRLAIESVQRYALQIAEAVGRAHRAGIVHRDLKPGNIMVTDDGLVKVLDFGLAKVTQVEAADTADVATRAALTRAGTTVGTLGYMSPEQAIGDAVDARSDVFSFGVILYEMLGGRLPFEARTLTEMLRELHFGDPPPIGSLRADTPDVLRSIVEKALQKKPADRFANMSEVVSAMSGGGVAADAVTVAVTSPARPIAPAAKSRTLRMVAAAALVVVAIGIASVTWQDRTVRPSGDGAAAESAAVPASAYELIKEAASLLARQDRDGNADRAIERLERALTDEPNSAIAHAHLASAYLRKQQTNPDPQWLKLARENAQRAIDLNVDLAAAHAAMGFVHLQAVERSEAETAFRRAIALDPMNGLPHMGLALNFAAQNKDTEADAEFGKAIDLGKDEWRAHGEYAQFHFQRARYDEALTHWKAALSLTPDNVVVMRNLSSAYFFLDRRDEAASILQRALEVRPVAGIYTNLGTIRFFQGHYTEAVDAFERAVKLAAGSHLYWGNLGDGYRWAPGRKKDAPTAYRRAIDLIDQQIAQKRGDPDLESRRAVYLVKLGDRDAALNAIAPVSDGVSLTPQVLFRVTTVYELAGARERALVFLERALKAGYAVKDVAGEPEFTALRADARYHRLIDSIGQAAAKRGSSR